MCSKYILHKIGTSNKKDYKRNKFLPYSTEKLFVAEQVCGIEIILSPYSVLLEQRVES
jgi:hypothetical protein